MLGNQYPDADAETVAEAATAHEWNDSTIGVEMEALAAAVADEPFVEEISFLPGGARDAMRVWMVHRTATLPETLATEVYSRDLAVSNVDGAMVGVTAPLTHRDEERLRE